MVRLVQNCHRRHRQRQPSRQATLLHQLRQPPRTQPQILRQLRRLCCLRLTGRRTKPAARYPHLLLDNRTILLQQAGALADDEAMDALLADIYRQRGRPETE